MTGRKLWKITSEMVIAVCIVMYTDANRFNPQQAQKLRISTRLREGVLHYTK